MVLDNEKQRGFLMGLTNAVPISGTFQQIRGTIAEFDSLLVAIANATIAVPKGNAADVEKVDTARPEQEPA